VSQSTADSIDKLLYQLPSEGFACKVKGRGYQVGVALVETMSKHGWDGSKDSSSRGFAKQLHDQWGVGYSDCNSGVLLLVAKHDRKLYISTGEVARLILDDNSATYIIENMKPLLKRGDMDGAIKLGVEQILSVLKGNPIQVPKSSFLANIVDSPMFFLIIVLAVFGFIGSFTHCFQNSSSKGFKTKLDKIRTKRAEELANHFQATHCPICLEDFVPETETELLACGHKFCKACLHDWFTRGQNSGSKCPICRQSVAENSLETTSSVPFELNVLRTQYPSNLSAMQISQWMSHPSYHDTSVSGLFYVSLGQRSHSSRSYSSYSSYRSSSSSDFGGGSSDGGGGAGGSW